tara:strand:- start:204 stop:629 length:426 start_codon:yes stop_codon:yes gene_type:complete
MTATEYVIQYVYDNLELELVQEMYKISIDNYTFRRELEWYFYEDVLSHDLLRGIPRSVYSQKSVLLAEANWVHVARQFLHLLDRDAELEHSEILNSYHNQKYYKDKEILDSGRYELVPLLGTNAKSSKYRIRLKPMSSFLW